MPNRLEIAETVREACLRAALAAYEEAGIRGLCGEGRWALAMQAIRNLDLRSFVAKPHGDQACCRCDEPHSQGLGANLHIIWAGPDVCRLLSANLGCWQNNVGSRPQILSVKLGKRTVPSWAANPSLLWSPWRREMRRRSVSSRWKYLASCCGVGSPAKRP